MRILLLLGVACGLAAGAAVSKSQQRIVGGDLTTIDQYPNMASLLYSGDLVTFTQFCGGTIINNRAVLTAAQCLFGDVGDRVRFRVGSSYAHSEGTVYPILNYYIHPDYTVIGYLSFDNDLAIVHSPYAITFITDAVQAAYIAGTNYVVPDNTAVWAAGWGRTGYFEEPSEQLRHVEIFTVNQQICKDRFGAIDRVVTDAMFCAGILDVGGKDQCYGDSGSPVYHQGVVVGLCSWGEGCADPHFPGVNTRLPQFTPWILENA